MTLLRRFLFVLCITFTAGMFAQERADHCRMRPRCDNPRPGGRWKAARLAWRCYRKSAQNLPAGLRSWRKWKIRLRLTGKPMLPKGTLVEGHLETTPARRMMRRGALRMIFDRIKLPDGTVQPARFVLSATESDSAKTDSEGTVHPTVSKKRLAIQLGGTALVAKLADDLSEEALATSAGSARWYGLAASTTFLLLQKGCEVKLKSGEVIEVDFVRDGSVLPVGAPPQ